RPIRSSSDRAGGGTVRLDIRGPAAAPTVWCWGGKAATPAVSTQHSAFVSIECSRTVLAASAARFFRGNRIAAVAAACRDADGTAEPGSIAAWTSDSADR